jgi:hypothetical protein
VTVHAYTSFSFSYLNRARVLASTLRRQHPDWIIWAVLTDRAPAGFIFDLQQEGYDRVVTVEDLFCVEVDRWLFGHDIVEACTAVKGRAMQHILADPDCEKLIYLDPDIAVFNPLTPIVDLLSSHSIVLTPHQVDPAPASARVAIMDNEVASLNYGVFNLGFIAVANDDEGRRFADWWADRLHDWCHDRLDEGIFVDQKWCNLVPCFFDSVRILRDPGYNVASWNLNERKMTYDARGAALINGVPLRFYHFTKLGPVGDMMTQRYAGDNVEIYELWFWYRHQIASATDERIPKGWWHYGTFDNGRKIPTTVRRLYRDRQDVRDAFAQPFKAESGFYDWLVSEGLLEIEREFGSP